jgi:hypothetical protein
MHAKAAQFGVGKKLSSDGDAARELEQDPVRKVTPRYRTGPCCQHFWQLQAADRFAGWTWTNEYPFVKLRAIGRR